MNIPNGYRMLNMGDRIEVGTYCLDKTTYESIFNIKNWRSCSDSRERVISQVPDDKNFIFIAPIARKIPSGFYLLKPTDIIENGDYTFLGDRSQDNLKDWAKCHASIGLVVRTDIVIRPILEVYKLVADFREAMEKLGFTKVEITSEQVVRLINKVSFDI